MKIVLEFSEEIRNVLESNRIELAQILNEEGIDMKLKFEKSPLQDTGEGEKALVPIIIASAAAITSITFAISKLLEVIYHRPHFVEYTELEIVKDKDGNLLLNENNEPVYKKVNKFKLIDSRPDCSNTEFTTSLTKSDGLVLSYKTSTNEITNK